MQIITRLNSAAAKPRSPATVSHHLPGAKAAIVKGEMWKVEQVALRVLRQSSDTIVVESAESGAEWDG